MPSQKALNKASHAFKKLLETKGPEAAQAALDKRGGQVPAEQRQRAQAMIDKTKMNMGGYVMPMNNGGFLGYDPLEEDKKKQMQQPNYVQGGGPVASQPGIAQQLGKKAAMGLAEKAVGTAALPLLGPISGLLPMLFRDGIDSVPDAAFGSDPLRTTDDVVKGGVWNTSHLPKELASPADMRARQHMKGGGYAGWKHYAQGEDSVPAMLTPGEAVIPAPAAQDPANQQAIQGMISQGRQMNDGMAAESPMESEQMMVAGPISGKTQREQMKLMQDMSLKKKSWMMDEKRKQEAHELKMKQSKMKGALAMKQSQE